MSDGPREIGRMGPASHPLVIGVEDGEVTIGLPNGYWNLNAAQRDVFSRLYFDAEAEAEKWQQEHPENYPDGESYPAEPTP